VVAGQNPALRVTVRERFATDLSHDLVGEESGNLFGTAVPEADAMLPVQDINANREVLQHGPVQSRIFEKRRHD
jgi:hypothetical protein